MEANFCVCCVLLAASLNECEGEGDGLGREKRMQQREWGTGMMKWTVLMGKDEVEKLASFLTEEVEGKCLDRKRRRGLDIGDWRF